MFDVIVLGATYAAAGIAEQYQKSCLILERRAEGGYEFFHPRQNADPAALYKSLGKAEILFCTETVCVEKKNGAFLCKSYGVEGFRTHAARQVVDTRCDEKMSVSKTLGLLVESKTPPRLTGIDCEKTDMEDLYILRHPVPLSCGFSEARGLIKRTVESFPPDQRLILSANEFDFCVREGYPKVEEGIVRLPSKAYRDPAAAFEAGFGWRKEKEQ